MMVEDEAYCLLGLFGIHLSLIYGEGKNALVRLQQELLKTYNDESVLAWNGDPHISCPLLPGMLTKHSLRLRREIVGSLAVSFSSRTHSSEV